MSRLEASRGLRQRIRQRYKNQCAACGAAADLSADVAHLFEDATKRPALAETLIVLCSCCNEGEDRAKSPSKPALNELFDAAEVRTRAARAYRDGKFSTAYGGFRLAAYLFERHALYSEAVDCLVEAVSALRPIRWGDFLKATLREVERLCLSYEAEVGQIQRWLFLDRLALVLFDYGRWRQSADVQNASLRLRSKIRSDSRSPSKLKFDRANSFRREALIKAFTGAGANTYGRLVDRLLEDAIEFEHHLEFDSFATNLDVASKLTLEIGKNCEAAHKYSEQVLDKAIKITHKWVLQEHYWREADYFLLKKDREKKLHNVVEALQVFRDYPVVLEPTLGVTGPVSHDPIADLEKYGITLAELREFEVAPSQDTPRQLPLELDRQAIDQLVKNIMR